MLGLTIMVIGVVAAKVTSLSFLHDLVKFFLINLVIILHQFVFCALCIDLSLYLFDFRFCFLYGLIEAIIYVIPAQYLVLSFVSTLLIVRLLYFLQNSRCIVIYTIK